MSEQAQERILSGIDIPKVLAGALAAVCAAVVGSFLGVAGTLIGAALASIVGSIGTEVYTRSLQRGAKKLQTLAAPAFVKAPAAVGTPEVAAATEQDLPSHTVPEAARGRQIRWGRIAAAAAGVFVLAMGGITLFEWAAGEPLASAVGASNDTGTTWSNVGNTRTTDDNPTPATSTTPSGKPGDGPTGTATPTGGATTTPTTEPATEPTTTPATGEPVQPTDPGTGAQNGGDSGGNLAPDNGSGGGAADDGGGASSGQPGE